MLAMWYRIDDAKAAHCAGSQPDAIESPLICESGRIYNMSGRIRHQSLPFFLNPLS
jgi:hypothetical protein